MFPWPPWGWALKRCYSFGLGGNQLTLTFWYGPTKNRWWTYRSTRLVFPTLSFPSITTLASTRMVLIVTGYGRAHEQKSTEAGVGEGRFTSFLVVKRHTMNLSSLTKQKIEWKNLNSHLCKITNHLQIRFFSPFVSSHTCAHNRLILRFKVTFTPQPRSL